MKINDDVIQTIIEQAKKDAPIESCGDGKLLDGEHRP